jgi:hypothetical protein
MSEAKESPVQAQSDRPTLMEALDDVNGLITGVVVGLMPALLLAFPAIVLLGLVFVPLAAVTAVAAVIGAIAAAPFVLIRLIRRG